MGGGGVIPSGRWRLLPLVGPHRRGIREVGEARRGRGRWHYAASSGCGRKGHRIPTPFLGGIWTVLLLLLVLVLERVVGEVGVVVTCFVALWRLRRFAAVAGEVWRRRH